MPISKVNIVVEKLCLIYINTGGKGMPVFHMFLAGGKKYMFDANANSFLMLSESLYTELEEYKRSEYKVVTPAIEKLKEQGYLKDRADFEMVHPMDSTLEYALDRCIGTVALQVTQSCNLRCKYCSYSGNYDNRVHDNKRMSKETAFRAIDFLFAHSVDRDRVSLGFYGGEPLLELNLIKECVEYAKKKSVGKELMFNMTSNATLITDDVLEYLYDNKFSLTISLDGDRHAHNKNRVFAANNNGTFDVVMKTLEKLQKRHPDYLERVHINAVIDPTTDFDCTSRFFSDYETVRDYYVQANLISGYYRKGEVASDEEYRNKFSYEIFKMYLQKLGRIEEGSVSKLVSSGFKNLKDIHENAKVSSTSLKRDHHSGPCVPGIQRLFVDVEGNLYPCERVSEASKAVRIGHIDTGFDIDRARTLLNIGKLTEKECKKCWAFRFCTSCPVQADDLEKLSAEKKLQNCKMIRAHADSMMRDYCVMRDLGYDFDKEKMLI